MATRTRTAAPTRVQLKSSLSSTEVMNQDGVVKCTGHGRVCSRLVAGKTSKNPGRAFYTCPLNRDDPNKCKFFKWEDELDSTTPQKPKPIQAAGRTIGQSPQTLRTPVKANTAPKAAEPVIDEIDWDKVDTDELENQAILSTPGSSQQASQGQTPGSTSFQDRLRAAVDDGVNKRKREDEEQTPKRAKVDTDNPFLSTPTTPRSPSHPVLSPALASLEQVSEHIQRQERLIRAGEHMKQGLRKHIAGLTEKNEQLEARVKELERKLAQS